MYKLNISVQGLSFTSEVVPDLSLARLAAIGVANTLALRVDIIDHMTNLVTERVSSTSLDDIGSEKFQPKPTTGPISDVGD